jgi:glycosyltransferase involved in cell wall biosynthesis
MERKNNINPHIAARGKIVACIPAYNAGASIRSVVTRTMKFVDHVMVIDDGSTDDTREQAAGAGAEVISHSINLGYGSAIATCLKEGAKMGASVIITLDSDLQHNPDEIPLLIQPILDGTSDMVTGSRFVTQGNVIDTLPTYRRFGITLLTKVTNFVAQTSISDATTGFRAYSNPAARALASSSFSPGMGASSQILMEALRSGLRVKEVPVNISYETGFDTSTQNAVNMGLGILTSIIGSPFRLAISI